MRLSGSTGIGALILLLHLSLAYGEDNLSFQVPSFVKGFANYQAEKKVYYTLKGILSEDDLKNTLSELSVEIDHAQQKFHDYLKYSYENQRTLKNKFNLLKKFPYSMNLAVDVLSQVDEFIMTTILSLVDHQGDKNLMDVLEHMQVLRKRFHDHVTILASTVDLDHAAIYYPGGPDEFRKQYSKEYDALIKN